MQDVEIVKKEAWFAVNDIVDDLLKDVFIHVDKITTIHEGFNQEIKKTGEDTNELVDAVHGSECDMVLTGFTHRHSSFQIIQLSVAKQHKSGYCGHYALHNALMARKMCQASNTDEIQELMKMIKSSSAYWWRYWLSLRQLLNCVTYESWWPWTEDHIMNGDMERSFLHYLLEQHHSSACSDPPILVMQYAYGYIQDSVTHIKKLHQVLTSFKDSTCSSHLIFILGITNHWASALITKDVKNKKQSVSVVYFDSCNVPVVTYTDKDIVDHMKKKEEEDIKKKGKGWTEWEVKITKQSYIDQREVVHMLACCAAGSSNLCSEVINCEVDKMTKDFNSSVVDQWKDLVSSQLHNTIWTENLMWIMI